MKLSPNPIALGLVLFGALAVIAGMFLPAYTCEETDDGGWSYCEEESGRLFQDDAFDGSTSVGLLSNIAEISIIVLAVLAIFGALTRSGLTPLSLALLGFIVFEGFLLWSDIDDTNDYANGIKLAFGWAWLLLGSGVLLILVGAVANLVPGARKPSYPPSSYYGQPQQPPSYTPWS
ncbi:MAG TPA: hypothetical protein VHP83_05725 [Aggregatilineaceae bacterium]|nr:hypothetical protein [Aggregatilineaceae bacterium]